MGILRVKEILREKGIKGKELAVQVGISEIAMSNIVKGQSLPRQEVLLKIAKTLDVDIRELFNPTKEIENPKEALEKVLKEIERIKDKM